MPDWKPEIRWRLADLQLAPVREAAIVEELAQDLDDSYAALLTSGASEAEAYQQTLAELHNSELLMRELGRVERHYAQEPLLFGTNRRKNMIADLWQDLRFGARMLTKRPSFTLIAVVTLALGIGANTAIFSLLDALLLKPLPVKQPEQLVVVNIARPSQPGRGYSSFSYPVFREMQEKNAVFSGLFARSGLQMSMSASGQTELVRGEAVSGNFFAVLGLNPQLGRLLTEADDQTSGAHPVAVLSFNFCQRRFGADPNIVGKTINLNNYPFTIIGIAQAQAGADNAFQIAREPDVRCVTGDTTDDRNFKALRIQLSSAKTGNSNLSRQFSQPLTVLMCMVAVVLLIACLNIANLLLARATMRQKEIAVRLALGAGRFRLVRQLLTEGLLLSASGGTLGFLFARWGTTILLGFLPQGRLLDVKPDQRMLGFTLGITVLSALFFGLLPALQATRPNLPPALKNETVAVSGSGRRWELRRLLVVLQVALSLVLLVGGGLFVRSLRNLQTVEMGYHTDQVITLSLNPAQKGYKSEALRNFYNQLSERLAALPGVKTMTFARNVPMSGAFSRYGIEVPGYQARPGEEMAVLFNQVAPQFFATFGTPLLLGREFSAQDTPQSPKVAIVNQGVARRFFGSDNALGQRITLENYQDLEIVGVVADAKYRNLKEAAPLTAYIPYAQYEELGQRTL